MDTVLDGSLSPQPQASSLKYIQYFCGLRLWPREKISHPKLHRTPKREIFLQDKTKEHGKADACRAFLL